MNDLIQLAHGSGCTLTRNLIMDVFVSRFGILPPLTDSAILTGDGFSFAFTTDSYVVDPIFFPGGDIGKLAVCGTVNDLAVSGAEPRYLAASFIIEEGFPFSDLERIVTSMASEAAEAGVLIVTGDTKVVEKGKCDKMFITTAGTGIIKTGMGNISTAEKVKAGDAIIVNGPVGNHAVAIVAARNDFGFRSEVTSDCSSLNKMIKKILSSCNTVRFMRDLTRGGLAAVLNELAEMTGMGADVDERSVPVDPPVRGFCEMSGLDPLYLANEGKIVIVAADEEKEKITDILMEFPQGKQSAVIGKISEADNKRVILHTAIGGRRILEMPTGLQLPRIC